MRAQEKLLNREFQAALDLSLQAEAVNPTVQNKLTKAQALIGLGRAKDSFATFQRCTELEPQCLLSLSTKGYVAFGDAARLTDHRKIAEDNFLAALQVTARGSTLNSRVGEYHPLSPRMPDGPHTLEALYLAVSLRLNHVEPEGMRIPKTDEELLQRLNKLASLAPDWETVWPYALWKVHPSAPKVWSFAVAKLEKLSTARDRALVENVRDLRLSLRMIKS